MALGAMQLHADGYCSVICACTRGDVGQSAERFGSYYRGHVIALVCTQWLTLLLAWHPRKRSNFVAHVPTL